MTDIILVAIIILAVGGAGYYVYRAKKNGQACIGCPSGKQCGSANGGKCTCGCDSADKKDDE